MAKKKGWTIKSVSEEAEQVQPSYRAGGIVKRYSYFGKHFGASSKC